MPKTPISVTLAAENLTWLKGRTRAAGVRSVSELLDRLVTDARTRPGGGDIRSVRGTIDIDPSDPLLDEADAGVRGLFAESLRRPVLLKERRGAARRTRTRRG